ncbi:MAG: NADH-quinone oxidoreductase subunit J [Leptospiraceae bacterium]|nr:NADH-quinone oxidoreductase subunit J [Leptospiraceae bacterium]MCP5511590.1 NADH-quinone oxidoreductase subunit J [Leptospiraceae bacterium]
MALDLSSPQPLLFLVFAGICAGSSLAVVLHKNPVVSAASLVLSFFALAGIYAVMNAVFIATMQIIVYTGAIMVLVIFVIMLLSLREETNLEIWKKPIKQSFIILLVLTYVGLITAVMNFSPESASTTQATDTYQFALSGGENPVVVKGNTATVGATTFLNYLLPFEMVSILLTAAVIGAVVIAKREKIKTN